jgi:colanic acid biosynthesis glycosyl transferase WcaI
MDRPRRCDPWDLATISGGTTMHVLNICHVYPPEHAPAGVQARDFAEDMSRRGHAMTVLTGWPNHPAGVLHPGWKARFRESSTTPEGFTLVRCGHSIHPRGRMLWRLWYYFTFAISTLVNGLPCRNVDIVFCESTPIFGPLTALVLAWLKGATFVYRVHDVHPEAALNAGLLEPGLAYRLLRALDTWVCRRSTLVLTLTTGMRRTLLDRGLPAERVVVARQWFDGAKVVPQDRDNAWRRAREIPLDQFVVLYAGTIGHISGARVVIDAAERLRGRSDILFLFVGEGPVKEECERLARERHLDRVRFLPFQPAESLSEVQATGDVGLVTLLPESGDTSVPSKIHGYTAAGRPVIASVRADSATAETVREGDFGHVVPPGDARALAEAITAVADAPAEAARLGANARRFFVANYDRTHRTSDLERILRRDVLGEVPDETDGRGVHVRAATADDIPAIAAVHTEAFPGFFLTRLGPGFLRAYYRAVLRFDGGLLYVAADAGGIVGFVAGFIEPSRFYAAMKRSPWTFAGPLTLGLARRPWLLARAVARVAAVVIHRAQAEDRAEVGSRAELSSLAVRLSAQGKGIGRRLVQTFLESARRTPASVVSLTTDAMHNDDVNAFYQRSGFGLARRRSSAGRLMNEYEIRLRAAA